MNEILEESAKYFLQTAFVITFLVVFAKLAFSSEEKDRYESKFLEGGYNTGWHYLRDEIAELEKDGWRVKSFHVDDRVVYVHLERKVKK